MFDADQATLDALDASATLAFATGAQAAEQGARVALLEAAAHWADLHGVLDKSGSVALPGAERLISFGGAGTPSVAEFCPAELGAVLGISPYAASRLISDALDLRHRLPVLWGRVRAGEVKAWMGQQVAQATRDQSAEIAAIVDATITPYAHRLSWGRLEAIIDAVIIEADPAAAAEKARHAALEQGVWVSPSTKHGIKDIHIKTEAPNAIWFDAAIDRIADGLEFLGDTDIEDVRRGKAVGVIAQPQQALDLFAQTAAAANGDRDREPSPFRDLESTPSAVDLISHGARATRPSQPVDPRPPATLYVHISDQVFSSDAHVARVEGVGPVLADDASNWLRGCAVTVKPVIDLSNQTPVDACEIPDRLREAVHLRSPVDSFPYGSNTRRSIDLDHTTEYIPPDTGGPPGQTRLDNLAALTRHHHRIKTHSRWQVRQPFNGVLVWKSPHGHHYLVDHTGTQRASI